jgi:Na+-driven multidrug efflux pump
MYVFCKDQEVISLGVDYIRITAPTYIFIAFGVVFNRALAGAGDTVVPMFITFLSLWGFQVPMALFLCKFNSLGITGVWWAVALASVLNGFLMLIWFEMGRWKRRTNAGVL